MTLPHSWAAFWEGRQRRLPVGLHATDAAPVLLPGSFNPLHHGHRGLAATATRLLGQPVAFELSVENVDKPPLDEAEAQRRLSQFEPHEGIWLTRAPTFLVKAELFPGAAFVVGVDTILRLADPRYYAADPQQRDAAVQSLAVRGCRFLVFGRKDGDRFLTLDACRLPPALQAICRMVPEVEFRCDLASTDLRQQQR
jgi:hypothetical protein